MKVKIWKKNGVVLGSHLCSFKIHSIVCDASARAFIRNSKGHNAYYGCDRCVQPGEWKNKVIYPETAAAKRTDEGFEQNVMKITI